MHDILFHDDGDYIVYGLFEWPSNSYWMVPGTWLED